ncbi:FAD-binding oxidoreductase [Abditibacterium utsteinense]|nr:FAD-binding oxidoreductase [Abditibacterium utsteinense]
MLKFPERELAGWGRFPRENCRVARAEKGRELREVAQNAPVPTLIARGLGRSYGDAALNLDAGVVLLEKLNRFLDFDEQNGILNAEAGASFASIAETFTSRGWFLPVVPGTKWITLGGAIAADVHGKNHHIDGSLSQFIESFELILASGETLSCSRTENSEAFWVTLGGMGLTGIIASAKLQLMPIESAFVRVSQRQTRDLDETLALLSSDEGFKYSVAWIDCLSSGAEMGRSIVLRGNHALASEIEGAPFEEVSASRRKKVPLDFPDFALTPFTVRAFNAAYYAAHPNGDEIQTFETFFWPLDVISDWNRIYGARGFVQYQCVLPFETARDGLKSLLEKISASNRAAFLGVLKKYGASDEAPLGFAMPGYGLALDLPATPEVRDFAQQLDEITLRFGGRVYLAKDAALSPQSARKMYPRIGEFERIKAQLDPGGRFQSSLSKRLEIGTSL